MNLCKKEEKCRVSWSQQNCYVFIKNKQAESAEDQQNCYTKCVFCSLFPLINYWRVCFIFFLFPFDIIKRKDFWLIRFYFLKASKYSSSIPDRLTDPRRFPGTIAKSSTVASKWRKIRYLTHPVPTTRGFWDQKYINVDGCDFYIQ